MRIVPALCLATAVLAGAGPAAAQYAPGRTYAIEVAPGTYVIHRPDARLYPYVAAPAAPRRHARTRLPARNAPVPVEELRRGHATTRKVVHTTKIVRDKPIVIEHRRVVDDPPRVIERVRVEDGPPARAAIEPGRARAKPGETRVIRADAEVTVLGPDRMSIRLIRKGGDR